MSLQKILNDVRNLLEYHQLMGVREIPVPKKSEVRSPKSEVGGQKLEAQSKKQETRSQKTEVESSKVKGQGSKEEDLRALREEIGDCKRCQLCQGRTNLVFGVGNPNAKLMFIGEGPGRDEDIQGEPFVGRAGQLLTKIIEAMGLKRSDVYIANVVKCRPPENRAPEPDEIACCMPFLLKQIEIISPKVIVSLGKIASGALLNTDEPMSKLRGHMKEFLGTRVMPTFHPAYLLRNPDAKKLVWEDVKKVMEIMPK